MSVFIPPASKFKEGISDKLDVPSGLLSEVDDYKKEKISIFTKDRDYLLKCISKVLEVSTRLPTRFNRWDYESHRILCKYAIEVVTLYMKSQGYIFKCVDHIDCSG